MEPGSGTKISDSEYVSNNNNENSLQASKVSKENNHTCNLHNLGTRIPVSTHKRLLQFVFSKHGKINGALSLEVTNAIESWIDKQQQTTSFAFSSYGSGRPRADKIDKLRRIAMELKQLTSFPYVNPFTIRHAIENVLGSCDTRTLRSYLKIIKIHSKENIASSGMGSEFDVTKFVEKIQGDDW